MKKIKFILIIISIIVILFLLLLNIKQNNNFEFYINRINKIEIPSNNIDKFSNLNSNKLNKNIDFNNRNRHKNYYDNNLYFSINTDINYNNIYTDSYLNITSIKYNKLSTINTTNIELHKSLKTLSEVSNANTMYAYDNKSSNMMLSNGKGHGDHGNGNGNGHDDHGNGNGYGHDDCDDLPVGDLTLFESMILITFLLLNKKHKYKKKLNDEIN